MKAAFTVVFEEAPDGITVTVPSLPGVVTCGRDLAEARCMAQDAIRCHIEGLLRDGEPVPVEQHVDVERLEVELPAA